MLEVVPAVENGSRFSTLKCMVDELASCDKKVVLPLGVWLRITKSQNTINMVILWHLHAEDLTIGFYNMNIVRTSDGLCAKLFKRNGEGEWGIK